MNLFRRKKKTAPVIFEEDSLDAQFGKVMDGLKDLSRKDYNKFKKAMDKDYDAYQILHGIEPVDDTNEDDGFMLSEEAK